MLNRRKAIAALMTFPLADYRAFAQSPLGTGSKLPVGRADLTVDLDKWHGITVKLGKETVHISSAEIFEALSEDNG